VPALSENGTAGEAGNASTHDCYSMLHWNHLRAMDRSVI
jgi:hypothetical protein